MVDMEKKKLDPVTKVKLLLAVEYGIFVIVFAVLGILFLTGIIGVADWKRYAFTYVTLAGGAWLVADFVWCLASPKRRAKNSMVDKSLLLPVGLFLIGFDIYAIVNGCAETLPYRYVIGIDFCVLAAIYAFETVYHWFRPIPGVIEAALEEKEETKNEDQ